MMPHYLQVREKGGVEALLRVVRTGVPESQAAAVEALESACAWQVSVTHYSRFALSGV